MKKIAVIHEKGLDKRFRGVQHELVVAFHRMKKVLESAGQHRLDEWKVSYGGRFPIEEERI